MKMGELAFKIHVSRIHAWRLACAGIVPGTKKTKGGHFYFLQCPALNRWINFMQAGGTFRKRVMARAYRMDYGNAILEQKKEEARLRAAYKWAGRIRKQDKDFIFDRKDLFMALFSDADELIQILEELTEWVDCPLKWEVQKTSRERLTVLQNLIHEWLTQQSKPLKVRGK